MEAGVLYCVASETTNELTQSLEVIRKHHSWKGDCETTCLAFQGNQSSEIQSALTDALGTVRVQNSTEFLVDLYREHCSVNLHCDSIFDLKDQLVTLQLVMAKLNKQETGEYAAQTQDVLEAHRQIMKHKLHMDTEDENISNLCACYDKFLSYCNAVDLVDILQRVKTSFIVNKSANKVYQASHQFVVIGRIMTAFEKEVLNLIAANRKIMCFEKGDNQDAQLSEKTLHSLWHEGFQPAVSPRWKIPKQTLPSPEKVAKNQLLQVFLCYLRLLVNSRDELALSQVINIPNRSLDHKQFTELRKVARQRSMPMFQVAVSFVLRIRLGGKSYAPPDDSPLLPLTKGLGELVSFFQKLQNICEETADAKAAILKVINMLKVNLTRSKERVFSTESIASVTEDLQQTLEQLSRDQFHHSNQRVANSTMVGFKSYLLIQSIIDWHVKQSHQLGYEMVSVGPALATPQTTHGKSKVHTLLTQFRTPDAEKVEILEEELQPKWKAVSLKKKGDDYKKICGDMSWAKPVVDINTGPSLAGTKEDGIHWQSTELTPKSRGKKRNNDDSYNNKENFPLEENDDASSEKHEASKPPVKRIFLHKDTANKKKSSSKARSHRKPIVLLQGQKQLTHFFR